MGLKERVEESPVVFLAVAVIGGFVSGFGAYETFLRVSDQTRVPRSEVELLRRQADLADTLAQELKSAVGRLGERPEAARLIVSRDIVGTQPVDRLEPVVRLGESRSFHVTLMGLTPRGYYDVLWRIVNDEGEVVARSPQPFVSEDDDHSVWWSIRFAPPWYEPGEYRLRVEIQGEDRIEQKVTVRP